MPSSKQKHRGQQSNDAKLFSPKWIEVLREAVSDLSFLQTRGYSEKSSLKIVGDRYRLNTRQRKALFRAACSDQSLLHRHKTHIQTAQLRGQDVWIDGYNLLITLEAALGGGLIFLCRDGCFRDIASVHGTYRRVEETIPALTIIGNSLQQLEIQTAYWFLDAPISNSGRLKTMMRELAEHQGFNWQIELVNNPDKSLIQQQAITLSSDRWILDHVQQWCNLLEDILQAQEVELIDLQQQG